MENENIKYIRITISVPEEVEDMITELYIQSLKSKTQPKRSRSSIISQAISEYYQKHMK